MQSVRVALLGYGVVGSAVARLWCESVDDLTARIGAPLELVGVAVRHANRHRDPAVDPALFTTGADALATRPDVDIVVELMGGLDPARRLLLAALNRGASVVTANKELLATDGAALHDAARRSGADLYYEAAVAGAIPLLRPMRESLAGDRIDRVLGIVNGTCNYVLSRIEETGMRFGDALAEAKALGYAEADPSADLAGFDAAAKTAILASLAFHTRVRVSDVHREGIMEVTAEDVHSAKEMGCVVKLLAIAERSGGGIGVRVHPAMVPRTHPLAAVRDAFNAVFVEAAAAGQLMFYGRGAGGAPTASAVLGDLVAAARHRCSGHRGPGESTYADLRVQPMGESVTRYYVRLSVADKAGVLASVASAFAEHDVSIQTVRQEGRGDEATLVLVTHTAADAALAATVDDLRRLDTVRAVTGVMRVEGVEGP